MLAKAHYDRWLMHTCMMSPKLKMPSKYLDPIHAPEAEAGWIAVLFIERLRTLYVLPCHMTIAIINNIILCQLF